MMEFIQTNLFLLACVSAGLCVAFATYVIIDFAGFTSARYKQKYLQETAVVMDDILLQLPPGRILDLSFALAALSAFLTVGTIFLVSDQQPTITKIIAAGVLAAGVTFPLPRVYLRYLSNIRLKKFNEQLEDALLAMSSSLKAGFSINQAFDAVVKENRNPISYDFTLLTQELRLGVAFDDALLNMSNRVRSQDFELVAIAIITARQTGGELTSILERLAGVIRERVRIMQKVDSLTAMGRMQAWIIGAMPFFLFFAMLYISPDMMNSFFSQPMGILIIIIVLILDICGFFVIRKITKIDI
jgi:tight adherence protein B